MSAASPQDTPAQPTPPPAEAAGVSGPAPRVEPPVQPSLEEQLAAAQKEAAGCYDRYLRAMADLENYRRRVVREKEELRQFAAAKLLQELLPVFDTLRLGLDAARQRAETKTVADGVALALEQFKNVLDRHGLKEINPMGQKFDPHLHESLSHQPSADVPEEHVLQVVRVGYALNGRLLRPASVVLSGGPAKAEQG